MTTQLLRAGERSESRTGCSTADRGHLPRASSSYGQVLAHPKLAIFGSAARLFDFSGWRDQAQAWFGHEKSPSSLPHCKRSRGEPPSNNFRSSRCSNPGSKSPGFSEPAIERWMAREPFQAGGKTILGLLRKGVPGPAMQSRFYVGINGPAGQQPNGRHKGGQRLTVGFDPISYVTV
jgi:hypothetical protein